MLRYRGCVKDLHPGIPDSFVNTEMRISSINIYKHGEYECREERDSQHCLEMYFKFESTVNVLDVNIEKI